MSTCVMGGTADLEIELNFTETDGIVLEQQGEFIARITNNGPDIAAVDATLSRPITLSSGVIQDNGSFTPEIQFAASSQNNNNECFFILVIGDPPPGGSVSYIYTIRTPPIQVNQTIECYGIFSTHFASGTREVNWIIRNNFDTDPIVGNNTQLVTFGIQPRSVPVNNLLFLFLLVFSIFLLSRKSIK
ncbi:hypothetical protein MNBD_GAMMA02-1812 [hydrothermal vent metagenome]|uniref:DUF11 domain-containing protein n=1 Tax=hydrothermal vent metagenome TaxID=652676 RepID=A0A3B0W5C5_9ZZZZ